ncbi:hypothetical protein QYE76_063673 [Lolium multiflorum]|uniref:CCHC-type domain-containing protein n=1 Tax=Lolium multiflorum TaxID=4521 RepID=A0AAD8S6X3_LOLMU|nr:hypothetical protein QYE76_063673 [Lolium multiflorum]
MPLMMTHTTIMWMLKYFNDKLKKWSKQEFNLNKKGYNKQIAKLNSKRNNNVFVMIKISFMHVNKNVVTVNKSNINTKGNLAHLKRPPPPNRRNDDEDLHQQPHNHNEDEEEERPPPRRNDRNEEEIFGKLKFTMPKFQGEEDPDAYLSWVLKVDKIFRIHNFSEAKKVAMASLEFEGYANVWWEEVNKKREKEDLAPIDTWEEMQEVMHTRFVPTHHKRDLFNKLTKLKQSFKSVEEYYKEMHMTMMSANVDEREEQTMARFLNGLNIPVKRIVEFLPYKNMVELLHQATRAERQVREDLASAKPKTFFAARNAMNASSSITNTSAIASKDPPNQARSAIKTTSFKPEQSTMSSKASTGSSNITCFKCGAQGHKSFECTNTRVMITRNDGNVDYLSEDAYEALVQAATTLEHEELENHENVLCEHDASPSLVVTKVLTTHAIPTEDQRCNIFQTRAGINGKSIKFIIDGVSCHNLASTKICSKLNLPLRKHPHPYHVQWLSDNGNVKIQHTVTISFKIGAYEDTVDCDIVPMTVCHMLLGRPWQYDKKANHDGHTNDYSFKVDDKYFILRPMTPSQVIADNARALARAKEATIHSDMRGEKVIQQKESERHKPYVSEMKSVLLATKSEMREVNHNPSTKVHLVLTCKGPSSETNNLTTLPSSLLSLLKEPQDVFLNNLSLGLPPLQGIEPHIDRMQGATLPTCTAYRTKPDDQEEGQRQTHDRQAHGENIRLHGRPTTIATDHDTYFMNFKGTTLKTKYAINIKDRIPRQGHDDTLESRTTLFQGGGGDDTGWPLDTASSRPTSPPRGPMTRARAQALRQEVNSLLSTYDFDTPLDGLLLHANTLCSIGTSTKTQAMETKPMERSGNDEDGATAPGRNFRPPGPNFRRSLPDASGAEERVQELPPVGPELPSELPPSSPSSEIAPKHPGCYCKEMAQFRN